MPGSLGPASVSPVLIVDSWPVMEWLKRREPTTTRFRELLAAARSGEVVVLLSSFNLGEIYYNAWNEWNDVLADETLVVLQNLPIHVIHPTQNDVLTAARIKGKHKVSYADAFAAVLAVEYASPVLTGDPDFLKLRDAGLIAVEWLVR